MILIVSGVGRAENSNPRYLAPATRASSSGEDASYLTYHIGDLSNIISCYRDSDEHMGSADTWLESLTRTE